MKVKQTKVLKAGTTRRGQRKTGTVISLDVLLSTSEITNLIQELERLKREGRARTGYHIHLCDSDAGSRDRLEVGLFHEKTYGPHRFSDTIILDAKKKSIRSHS